MTKTETEILDSLLSFGHTVCSPNSYRHKVATQLLETLPLVSRECEHGTIFSMTETAAHIAYVNCVSF